MTVMKGLHLILILERMSGSMYKLWRMHCKMSYLRSYAQLFVVVDCTNRVGTTMPLLNTFICHGATNALINKVFKLLHNLILLEDNNLPLGEGQTLRILKKLGPIYELIHICLKNFLLWANT